MLRYQKVCLHFALCYQQTTNNWLIRRLNLKIGSPQSEDAEKIIRAGKHIFTTFGLEFHVN